ncbi:MAG: hypothetical protein MZW92_22290, partial [Comamonadaceae bacterium]|nr:hypothetical protein [Comamonadaceae bacterium]
LRIAKVKQTTTNGIDSTQPLMDIIEKLISKVRSRRASAGMSSRATALVACADLPSLRAARAGGLAGVVHRQSWRVSVGFR